MVQRIIPSQRDEKPSTLSLSLSLSLSLACLLHDVRYSLNVNNTSIQTEQDSRCRDHRIITHRSTKYEK